MGYTDSSYYNRQYLKSLCEDVESELQHGECLYNESMADDVIHNLDKMKDAIRGIVESNKEETIEESESLRISKEDVLGSVWEMMLSTFKDIEQDFYYSEGFKDRRKVDAFIENLNDLKDLTIQAHDLYHDVNRGDLD